MLMTWCTIGRESQLPTNDTGITKCCSLSTNTTPSAITTNFNASKTVLTSITNQLNLSINTRSWSQKCLLIVWLRYNENLVYTHRDTPHQNRMNVNSNTEAKNDYRKLNWVHFLYSETYWSGSHQLHMENSHWHQLLRFKHAILITAIL